MKRDSFPIKLEPRNYKGTTNLIRAVIAAERPSRILREFLVFEFVKVCIADGGSSPARVPCLFLGLLEHDNDKILDNDFDGDM